MQGAPDTERIDLSTVRVNWDNVFPKGSACEEVPLPLLCCCQRLNHKISDVYETHFYQKQEKLKQFGKYCIACQVVFKTRGRPKKCHKYIFCDFNSG